MSKKAIQRYIEEKERVGSFAQPVPYNWYKLKDTLPVEWMAYSLFLQEHTRELANTLNEFMQYIDSLSAWEKVIIDLDQKEKHPIIFEFVSPLATLAINMPYVIRSRFIYSIAHLSHQANKLKKNSWVDDLPTDSEIYFKMADTYGAPWKKYKKTKVALEKISNNNYTESTHDFRNRYNHRYSPRIELGLTGLINRTVAEDEKVSYGLGSTDPLMLTEIIPLLKNQHALCMTSFNKYQALVREQITEINNSITIA